MVRNASEVFPVDLETPVRVSFTIPGPLLDRLQAYADENGWMRKSDVVVEALERFLEAK